MIINILLGIACMSICLLLQSAMLVHALRFYKKHIGMVASPSSFTTFYVVSAVMFMLVIGNIMQVGIWAALFSTLNEFDAFHISFYHSAVNFSTLGYGDIVMSEKHRLLGPLEAINGVIMIGLSTASLLTIFQDAMDKTQAAKSHQPSKKTENL